MKPRTKEENAAYARAQREKKRLAAVSPNTVSPRITSIVSPTPCQSCAAHAAALAVAQERIESLEMQLTAAQRPATATPSHQINTYGKNPCIGVASR